MVPVSRSLARRTKLKLQVSQKIRLLLRSGALNPSVRFAAPGLTLFPKIGVSVLRGPRSRAVGIAIKRLTPMKKVVLAVVAFLFLSAASYAQQLPVADVSAEYSFLFLAKGYTLKLNGGSAAVAFNINRWLGAVGDFGSYDGAPGIPGLVGETYIFGPRFSFRRWNRLIPFVQGGIGGVHANTTNNGFLGANNGFAYSGGGGVDVALDRAGRLAVRGQFDFPNFRANGVNTGTLRLSAGIDFRLGKK